MKRIQAIAMASQAASVKEALLISNLGYPSRELYAVKDRRENFYMLGSMGLASSIGLGLALAQPGRKVMVLDGDGSMLMNLGTLATIAHYAPENYLLVILDNCCYGSTGSQPSCTSRKTDLAGLAEAAGVEKVRKASSLSELEEALDTGLDAGGVVVVRVDPGNAQVPVIDISPPDILRRFRGSFLPVLPA
jgi:sulfopyruvate decarboxylase subunit beta